MTKAAPQQPTANKMTNLVVGIMILLTLVLVGVQFQVSSSYEIIAKRIGVFDRQSKAVNTVYLDYEEQAAIMRSSNFLITEKGQDFVSAPAKVIYLEPLHKIDSSISQNGTEAKAKNN